MGFIEDIKGKRGKGRISNSIGVYDIYKMLRKDKWLNIGRPLKEHEFYSIIRTVNNKISEDILDGVDISLPYGMGKIFIQKTKPRVFMKDGRIINTFPVDWNSTLELWSNDEEAYKDKVLLRHERKYRLKVKYTTIESYYTNKSFYVLDFNRELKNQVNRKANSNKLDGYLKYIEV